VTKLVASLSQQPMREREKKKKTWMLLLSCRP